MDVFTRISTTTLNSHPRIRSITNVLEAALEAANPSEAVRSYVRLDGVVLSVGNQIFQLDLLANIYVIAFGKAAFAMASAACEILGSHLSGGVVVSKYMGDENLGRLSVFLGGHPIPDERSELAGDAIRSLLEQSGKDDLVLFLISGGGSALITSPVKGVSLDDLQTVTSQLLASGASIDEINTLRRALDEIKGGGLARMAFPSRQVSLILSDVVDSPLEAIASGPTVPNPTSNDDARAMLEKYDLLQCAPSGIVKSLEKVNKFIEVPIYETLIIGSNRISAEAAHAAAQREGFSTRILTTSFQGEASEKGKELASLLLKTDDEPLCLIAGGETTVTLRDEIGKGGRNQEMALAAVEVLDGVENCLFITFATDGEDGPTDAAGAVVSGKTFMRANALGFSTATYLEEHNSYPYFEALGDLLKTGPTGTNVNDLAFLFVF